MSGPRKSGTRIGLVACVWITLCVAGALFVVFVVDPMIYPPL